MRSDNSRHIVAAARRRTQQTRQRAITALRRMDAAGQPVSFDSLAREAAVSRSWLYSQNDLRGEIERLRERHRPAASLPLVPDRQRASAGSLLRRLDAATGRIRQLEQDNHQLREALARALGERRTADILGQPGSRDTPDRKTPESSRPHCPQHSATPVADTARIPAAHLRSPPNPGG